MDFEKIKQLCLEKKITIPELSEKIGMSRAGLYTTIKKKTITVSILEKIAEVLEVPITVFFDIELPEVNENKISDLEKKLLETVEKLQSRQSIINLVLYSLKNITVRYNRLYLKPGALTENGDADIEIFLNETIESLYYILTSVKETSGSKVLGLDLGINSIGWVLRETSRKENSGTGVVYRDSSKNDLLQDTGSGNRHTERLNNLVDNILNDLKAAIENIKSGQISDIQLIDILPSITEFEEIKKELSHHEHEQDSIIKKKERSSKTEKKGESG